MKAALKLDEIILNGVTEEGDITVFEVRTKMTNEGFTYDDYRVAMATGMRTGLYLRHKSGDVEFVTPKTYSDPEEIG